MLKKALILLVFITTLYGGVEAQSISEQTKRREEIEREIAFLDRQLAANKSKQLASTKELNFIQRKITNRKRLLSQIESEIQTIDLLSVRKAKEIDLLNSDLSNLKKRYSHLVYNAYKHRDRTVWILYVLASDNLEQGYRRWSYLKSYSQALKTNAKAIKERSIRLRDEVKRLGDMRMESLKMQKKREQEYKSLAQEEKRARDIISQLSKKEREFRGQLTEKRREMERLNREIERILAEAAKEKKSVDYKEAAADRALSDKFENNKGRLPWPVKEGVIIEQFGQHIHPVFKNIKLPFNNGVNISTTLNAQAICVFDGVVKQILVMPGYNQCVLVQHGNYYTFYTKLERVIVKSGDAVKTGQPLGTLAEAEGNSVLHFQLWSGTTKQNPEHWISR
jgi:septal ring factor EnvC (AmiA/AmiB activator)